MRASLVGCLVGLAGLTQFACNDDGPPGEETGLDTPANQGDGDAPDGSCQARRVTTLKFQVAGFEREVRLYIPTHCEQENAALVIGLHGHDRTHSDLVAPGIDLDGYFDETAVVALPDALPDPDGVNAWGVDMTLALFDELVEQVAAVTEFDRDQIYIVGSSGGAFAANTLGCRRGDAIRGIAMQAGGMWSDGDCVGNPAVWLSHDTGDQYVPIEQGRGLRDRWALHNGCSDETSEPDQNGCVTHEGCSEPVQYCEHSGSDLQGHAWPRFATAKLGEFFASLPSRENTRTTVVWPEVPEVSSEQGTGDGQVLIQVTATAISDVNGPTSAPAEGATVAVETADGHLIEGTTDATGAATINGIDFAAGPINVTAYLSGHTVLSVAGITDEGTGDASVTLDLRRDEPLWGDQVTVSGTITEKPASTAWTRITGNVGTEGWQGRSNLFAVKVPTGEDITLVLSHWNTPDHYWKFPNRRYLAERAFNVFELGVLDSDLEYDLDLSSPAADTLRSGTFDFPADEGLFALQTARANVVVQPMSGPGASLGGGVDTVIDVETGTVRWQSRFVEALDASDVFTSYQLEAQDNWTFPHHPISARSGGLLPGYPGDVPIPALLPAATLTQPMRGQAWPLHAPLTWETPDDAKPHEFVLTNSAQDLEWIVQIPDGVTEFTIPRPPEAVTERLDGKPVAASYATARETPLCTLLTAPGMRRQRVHSSSPESVPGAIPTN